MKNILSGIGTVFTSVLDFVEKHPTTSAIVVNAASSALSPDEIDIMREKERLKNDREDMERRRREGNLNAGDIDLNVRPSNAKQLLTSSGTPVYPLDIVNNRRGIINGSRYG